MNAIEIYNNADRKLNKSKITLGEYERMIDPLRNVIPIPEGATNGDMIKAMFPNVDIKSYIDLSGIKTVGIDFKDNIFGGIYSEHTFSKDWWNAPYKEVEE